MEAFLASCALALPDEREVQLVKDDAVAKNEPIMKNLPALSKLKNFTKSFASLNQKTDNNQTKDQTNRKSNYPQIKLSDITLRLELYIRNLRRIYALREQQQNKDDNTLDSKDEIECVVYYEQPRVINTRIQVLLKSLIATTNSVGSMRPILTKLLTYLTHELLAVEHLSGEIKGYIRKIVLEFEHQTSFASLAFLSSPGDSAETHLSPLLYRYLEYLKTDWRLCIDQCKIESTLARALDPSMRHVFKTVEFVSIGHLLEVCQEYKHQLENIVISPSYFSAVENQNSVGTAMTDTSSPSQDDIIASALSGDVVNIKKSNSNTTKVIKQALRDLRREIITVNGYMMPPVQSLTELVRLLRERLQIRTVKLKERKIGNTRKLPNSNKDGKIDSPSSDHQPESDSSSTSYSNDSDIISSGNEGDTDGTDSSHVCRKRQSENSSKDTYDVSNHLSKNDGGNKIKRRNFNVNAIDIMTRRLLIAASRTGSGGDAYFVVRDLFGGDGVTVVPSTTQPMSPYIQGKISPTIELTVRLSSIIIRCHSIFNVYPDLHTGDCEPLIQLHTSITETIELQEVRLDNEGSNELQQDSESRKPTKLIMKEKKTANSGRKILSIKPARYEQVEDWRAPS